MYTCENEYCVVYWGRTCVESTRTIIGNQIVCSRAIVSNKGSYMDIISSCSRSILPNQGVLHLATWNVACVLAACSTEHMMSCTYVYCVELHMSIMEGTP